ncbi:Secoisolariciresinol dehydrogenase [Hibiscus syriacus]|uniref:Secoisolariciresinol dehydrogenase n=1 Tax=Hibiscus syriacus TaxID=106335 RepID=A0A6A2YMM1_HIBSY|nr:secoisolariciresinol dehydrogenase-like [Hibiscus syriacus]KAE8680555.1 Secoisolariciresinol dehydrogenase [Hibiscus syriacus]
MMNSDSSVAKRLEGKVALITGGASGIGESTTRLFIKHGAKVLVADIQDELGQSLCKHLGTPETISYIHCDVTSESDVRNAVDLAISKYGKLDIMFKRVFDVNVLGGFLGAKHAARVMVPAKKGCILFTASIVSKVYMGLSHAYTTSKHAVVGLTQSLAVELGEHGIRVNCISPYAIVTPSFQKASGISNLEKVEEMLSAAGVLRGAVLEPSDVAQAALFLASDDAKYLNGVDLPVDGGYSLNNQTWKSGLKDLLPE